VKKILVLGATGMLGAPVARQMLSDGFAVRTLARDPEKASEMLGKHIDIIPGDVTDTGSLEHAMLGCDAVHISVGGAVDQISAENVCSVAPRCGIQRIGYVSGSTVAEQNRWFPMVEQKLMAEQAIAASGVPYTVFCPTWPMDQLPRFVVGGRATVIGDRLEPWRWFAADDMGRMVSKAFQLDAAAGKRLYIHGPEPLTIQDALTRYCTAFHPEIESVSVMPIEAARTAAEATGNRMLKMFAEMMAYFEKVGEPGDPSEANQLLGAPATTLERWIERRKSGVK
jgi:uncharacterized protein YbjT (DUF2867 family)